MVASASSATPISCWLPEGEMMSVAFSGSSPKATMLDVSRRTGRSTMRWSAKKAKAATTPEIISDSSRMLTE